MFSTLLRRLGILPGLVLFLLGLGAAHPALASHLLGGEMTYKYLDSNGPTGTPVRYEITLKVYNNCAADGTGLIRSSYPIALYYQGTGTQISQFNINETVRDPCALPKVPPGCTITPGQLSYIKQTFVGVVNLPASTVGYYAAWTANARNSNIANVNADGQNMGLYCTMAPASLANSSPIFVNDAVANVCANDTTFILNNAVDPDGDQLVYSFGTPYMNALPGTWTVPPAQLTFRAGYNVTYPLGIPSSFPGNYASVSPTTGISKYKTTAALNTLYVVAVDVSEYRVINNRRVLIGVTRRDVQLVTVTCPATIPPALPTSGGTPHNFTIEAGSSLTIPLTATQPNGHPLRMTASSVLLDSTGGYNATFNNRIGVLASGNPAGSATVGTIGNSNNTPSTVSADFVYNSACREARIAPYDIVLLVEDVGCAGKTVADILHITVTKPSGPTDITGNFAVCGLPSSQTYTAVPGAAPTAPTINWRVVGGTIVGSNTANPVTVNWTTPGTGTIVARGVSQYGCFTDSVTRTVTLGQAPTLTVTGNQTICNGASTTLTVTGGAAPYTVTATGFTTVTGTGPFVLSPTATTTYTITATASGATCGATTQVTVTVQPKPVANAGAAVVICSGGSAQLGVASVPGNTYSWSPATGLSDPTIANPTVTLTNTTTAATTQTYTLTVTSTTGGCQSTSTVAVTVSPPAAAAAGANATVCSGNPAQLGAAPVTGNTYSWSPTTGLSDPTIANPVATLTNTTNAAITQTYTLTTTTAAGCTATGTVTVTVNPVPVVTPGAAAAFCSGGSASLGGPAVTGNTYSWSPATGLSSATVANPTVTLTNTTGAPITQTYTLTVTGTGSCTATGTVVVTVNPLPTAVPGPAVAFCSGGSASLGGPAVTGLTYSWSPTTGLSSATVANPTVTLTNTTNTATTQTYTLTVTGAGNCTATGTVAVTVNPLPAVVPGAAVAFCSGSSAQLGGTAVTGLTYSWSPTTGLSSATVANPTVTLTNTTGTPITPTYTLTVTNAGGCSNTGTVVVTVNPLPVATTGPAVAICSGSSTQLGGPAVTGSTYSWSPATGLSSATVANPTVTLTNTTGAPITRTYTLTVTGVGNCVTTGTVVVTVNPLPVAAPGAAVAFCSGGSASLGAAPVTGLTYSWSPATGLSSATVANPTVTLTNTTGVPVTSTYTLTVTNTATSCTSTGTVAVTVNPLPTVVPGTAAAICSGSSTQLGGPAVTGFTYSWSPATGLSSTTVANPTVTLTNTTGAPITSTYTLTVTNSTTSCVNTGTVAVTVNPLPAAVPGAALTLCSGGSAQLGAGPVAGLSYSWSPTTGLNDPTLANPTVTLTNTTGAPIIQTYTLTVTSAATCVSTGTVAVTVNPLPTVTPGAAVVFCSGNTAQLGAAPVAGLTYSWSPTTGLSNAVIANPDITLTNATGSAITSTYTLTVTNPATGCVNMGTVLVTVNSEILPGIVGPTQQVCASSTPAPLTSVPGPTGGYGTYAYQWESSPDNVTWTTIAGATSATYSPGPLAATTYYRRRVASGSCADAVSNAVMLELVPQLVTGVTLATPATQCAGLPITFTPVPTNAGGSPTYRWFVNNVPVASGPTFTSSTLANGDVVRVEVTPTVGFCATSLAIASVTVNLTLTALPTATIRTQTPLPICAGSAVDFLIDNTTNAGTSPTYQWQVNGVNVAGATGPTFTSTTLTDGQVVTLVISTPSACGILTATSNGLTISVNPYVMVNAGPDKTITEGETVDLEGTSNGNFPVTWTPNIGFSFPANNPLRPRVAPVVTTTYTLAAQVGNCYSESKVTITVTPRVRIPNAFTPNGDGSDDTWQIDRIGDYATNHVIIFNRWGNKLFETTNYNRGNEWNGTINGQPAPVGTYYYLITLGNGKSYTGPLTVMY